MRIPSLQQLSKHKGPFVTVSMDASRTDESAHREIEARWHSHREHLAAEGAAGPLLDRIGDLVLAPTGRSGSVGRLVVAAGPDIVLDLVLPARPAREEAFVGPAPHLLPAFRAMADRLPYLLVEVDRAGADISVVNQLGDQDQVEVAGDHDVLHKVGGGAMSHRGIQARVEDSWARNAAEVARELDTLVGRHRPVAVLLGGDVKAVTDVLDAASGRVADIAVRMRSGSRAEGASAQSRDAEVTGVLVAQARAHRKTLLDRFGAEEGRQGAAVQSLPDVVDAARRAQIDELLLHDQPGSTHRLWVGEEPLQLGLTMADVEQLGARDPQQVRADTALVWAIVHADAGVTLLDPDGPALRNGIGAVLRWSDRSTPHDGVPSMPGHGR
jgi:hypothetical protein